MRVVFVVFVDQFRKPLILLTFLDFWLVDHVWFLRVVLWSCGSLVVFWRACGFLSSLWFFGELVVFGRACGSLFPSRGKGQTEKDLTTESMLC